MTRLAGNVKIQIPTLFPARTPFLSLQLVNETFDSLDHVASGFEAASCSFISVGRASASATSGFHLISMPIFRQRLTRIALQVRQFWFQAHHRVSELRRTGDPHPAHCKNSSLKPKSSTVRTATYPPIAFNIPRYLDPNFSVKPASCIFQHSPPKKFQIEPEIITRVSVRR